MSAPLTTEQRAELRAWAQEMAKDPAWRALLRKLLTPRPGAERPGVERDEAA